MASKRNSFQEHPHLDETHLNNALEAANMATFDLNLKTGELWRSANHDQLFGYEHNQEDWTSETFFEHICDEDRERVTKAFDIALEQPELQSIRFRVNTPSGEIRWLEARGKLNLDDYGEPLSFSGVLMDISNRVEKDQTLWKYRHQIQHAAEVAHLGFWQYYPDRDELVWSDQVYHMLGLEENENISYESFMEMVHPDDRGPLRQAQQQAKAKQSQMNVMYRLKKQSGEIGYFREIGEIYIDPETKEVSFAGVILDITKEKHYELELEASERKFRQQFEEAPYGIMITAPDGRVFEANPEAMEILGYTLEEIRSLGRAGLVDPNDPINDLAVKQRRAKGFYAGELRMVHADGSIITVDMTSRIFTDDKGRERALVLFRDLSKQKELEKSLRSEQKFTDTIIQNIPGVFAVIDEEGKLIRWNKQLEEELELKSELIGLTKALDYVHPAHQEKAAKAIQKVWNSGFADVELKMVPNSGRVVPYYFRGARFKSTDKQFLLALGQSLEEREAMQAEIRKGQLLFEQLFQNAPIAISLVDLEGKIKLCNQAYRELFLYDEKELKGQKVDTFLVPKELQSEANIFTNETTTGARIQGESIRLNKKGEEVPVLVAGMPVLDSGEVQSVFAMYVDLTERKKLENKIKKLLKREKEARKHAEFELHRLQDMFEQAPSAISLVEGPDHRIVFANLQYQKLVDGRAVTGTPIGEAIPELANQGFIDILNKVRDTGETVQGEEVSVMLKKVGSDELEERMFKYLYKPLTNSDGEVGSIFIEVIDVTEESRAKQQIQQSLDEKTVLLQEIHHRVKNNLALISSILKLQVEEVDNAEIQKSLNDARNRIFSISKIHEVLYQDENLSKIAFADYIEELMDAIDESIKPAHTLINHKLDLDQIPLPINKAIPAGLLINELVTNAYEHAFKGRKSGIITICLNKQGDRIQLQIKDDGVGLPNNFEAEQGKSLGWTLIQTLTTQLKGDLEVESNQTGTQVEVTFPL